MEAQDGAVKIRLHRTFPFLSLGLCAPANVTDDKGSGSRSQPWFESTHRDSLAYRGGEATAMENAKIEKRVSR